MKKKIFHLMAVVLVVGTTTLGSSRSYGEENIAPSHPVETKVQPPLVTNSPQNSGEPTGHKDPVPADVDTKILPPPAGSKPVLIPPSQVNPDLGKHVVENITEDEKHTEGHEVTVQVEDTDDAGHLLELHPYNPYRHVAKAPIIFNVLYGPFSKWSYGPYAPDEEIYKKDPRQSIKEINERMNVLGQAIDAAKKDDPDLVEKKIHYADLSLMAWIFSQNMIDARRTVELYGQVYKEASVKFSTYVSLNLANAILRTPDAVTALPLLKKLQKNMAAHPDILRQVNSLLMEQYFLDGRYKKIDDILTRSMKKNEVDEQDANFKHRMGDNLFFMNRFQEAAEWYEQILKPSTENSYADNVSWLYFGESLVQTGNLESGLKIYRAMKPAFQKSPYRGIIDYRLSTTLEEGMAVLDREKVDSVSAFIRVDLVRRQYELNPLPYTSAVVHGLLKTTGLNSELEERLLLIKADALQREKRYFDAASIYRVMETRSRNTFVDQLLVRQIIACLYNQAMLSKTEDDAVSFLHIYIDYEFYFRTEEPKKIRAMLKHNLELMGLEQASPEMVLSAIERSVQNPKTKVGLIFEMAKAMYDTHALRTAWRLMEDVDINLLSYEEQEDYYRYLIKGFIDLGKLDKAIAQLDAWQKKGTSAKNTYWIVLKKTELNYDIGEYQEALDQVQDTLGTGDTSALPEDYQPIITDLLVYQTLLFNKLGKDTDALNSFETHQERMLKSEYKQEVIMAAISSGMHLEKDRDVKKYLDLAKIHMDKKTASWLEKWAQGEIWGNQIVHYLDRAEKVAGHKPAPPKEGNKHEK